MNILFLNHNVKDFGTYIRVLNFAKHLTGFGHSVVLMASAPHCSFKIQRKKIEGVQVICFPDIFNKRVRNGGLGPIDTYLRCLFVFQKKFDVVQNFDHRPAVLYPALVSKYLNKTPLVSEWTDLHGTGGSLGNRNPKIQQLIRPYEDFTELNSKKICDRLIVISKWLRKKAIALGVPASKITYVPGGADIDNIRPTSKIKAREPFGLPSDKKIIAYTAGTHYDIELFLNTISLIQKKDKDVLLVTTGAKFGHELHRAGCDPERIIEFGFMPYRKYTELLPAVDIFVFPFKNSILNKGRWPNKIGDYMAAGRPTISNPTGDIVDLFGKHKIGLLASENPEDFASKIMDLLKNQDLLIQLGLNARKTAEKHYSWKSLTQKLDACYKSIIK